MSAYLIQFLINFKLKVRKRASNENKRLDILKMARLSVRLDCQRLQGGLSPRALRPSLGKSQFFKKQQQKPKLTSKSPFFADSRHSSIQQRRRQLRSELQAQRCSLRRRGREQHERRLDSAGHLQVLVHHRRALLSIRRATLRDALRLVDLRRSASEAAPREAHGQPRGLLAERHLGHHKRARLRDLFQRDEPHGARVPLQDPPQDPLLHGQLDHTHRIDQLPQHIRLLSADRRGREDDLVHIHFARLGCVLAARLQDSAAHIHGHTAHLEIPHLHAHDEHRHHPQHGHNHQLELSHAAHSHHAEVGAPRVHQLFAQSAVHEAARAGGEVVGRQRAASEEASQKYEPGAERGRERLAHRSQCRPS